jgi:RNA polymerase sigma-70 factor (ECF subfamily)
MPADASPPWAFTEAAASSPPRDPAGEAGRRTFLAWVGALVHQHRAALAGVARREGLAPEDAFDAVQEAFQTFITLPEAHALLAKPEEGSRNLLVALTRNVSRNRRRLHATLRPHISDRAVVEEIPADVRDVEETIAAAEQHVRLAGCMLTLGEVPRAVVTLRMLDELPGEDVARLLGVSPGHVAVLLHRAKARLLTCMTTCGDAELAGSARRA